MSAILEPRTSLDSLDTPNTAASAGLELTKEAPIGLRFYRLVWRWHFYAGLFVIPFMLLLAITGIVQLFKPQLNAWNYRDLMWAQPSGVPLPYMQQLDAAKTTYPEAALASFRPADTPQRTAEIALTTADERNLTVFVNPYNGKVLGERNEDSNLMIFAEKLHADILLGTWGDRILELAACWAIVLVISGLYLWWPRKGSWVWGVILPRLNRANPRIFWRDLHAVPGFWGSLLLLFFLLTGLPWTGLWGGQFAKVWSGFPAQLWDDVPKSTVLTGVLNEGTNKVVPWAVEQVPMPKSDPASAATDHANHQAGNSQMDASMDMEEGVAAGTPVNLDSVIALAQAKGATPGFLVSLPKDAEGVYTVSPPFPTRATQEVTLHIDQYSGKILTDIRWKDYALVPKLVQAGTSLHMGGFFGLANQLLMLAGCLIVILMCLSATVMWWQRRPAGRLGAPGRPQNLPLWKGATAIVCILALCFPLMGASLLLVLLLDYLVIQRIPRLKQSLA